MPKRILVVDDEPTIRQVFDLTLSDAGYAVTAVGDGNSALSAVTSQCFDLIFLDILLPDAHGSEILAKLKQLTPTSIVCVVTAMTASDYQRIEDYTKLIKMGIKDKLLRKPLSPEEIVRVARELIGNGEPAVG